MIEFFSISSLLSPLLFFFLYFIEIIINDYTSISSPISSCSPYCTSIIVRDCLWDALVEQS